MTTSVPEPSAAAELALALAPATPVAAPTPLAPTLACEASAFAVTALKPTARAVSLRLAGVGASD
jgi:hypothetical protein